MCRLVSLVSVVVLGLAVLLGGIHPQAAAQAATPEGTGVAVAPLFATMLPVEELPTGRTLTLVVAHATIDPGAQIGFTPAMVQCCAGPTVDHVLSGEVTLRSDGPLQVERAAVDGTPGPAEDVPPGTEVVLRAGDSALYRVEMPSTYSNAGSDPVQLASGGLFSSLPIAQPHGFVVNDFDSVSLDASLVAGPLSFVLEQVTLPPDAMLPAPAPDTHRVITSGLQYGTLARGGDGAVTNIAAEPVVAYAVVLAPTAAAEGASMATATP
jgi:hypothetical protein